MPKIVWDKTGERFYHQGVSHGVIYFEDGRFSPWNGLVSVSESVSFEATPVYFDGRKVSNLASPGEFSASVEAYTFPEMLQEAQGLDIISAGVYLGEQAPMPFNMTYRTKVGSDIDQDAGYRIHILYNVTAEPSDATYSTIADDSELTTFSWALTSVPEEVDGFRPTSHVVLDSRKANPTLLAEIELMLYGGDTANPVFPAFDELMTLLLSYYIIEIIDNKDGTWTAIARGDYISVDELNEFEITGIDAVYLNPDTYEASSTLP